MKIFKNIFNRMNQQDSKTKDTIDSESIIEDVRSNKKSDGEIIINLWYVTNRIVISELRSKLYVASGTDDDKLRFLRQRANIDFKNASIYPVPESMKVDVKLVDGSNELPSGKACLHTSLEFLGGYPALFREILLNTPKTKFRFDSSQAMLCITGLLKGTDGELSVQIDNFSKL